MTKNKIPPSVLSKPRYYQLWKFCNDLTLEEISTLITKRRNQIKYETNQEEIRCLRTEIKILTNIYTINKRKKL